jgi:GNAT superfamily N-acetyltransferase
MRIVGVSAETSDYFFNCSHTELYHDVERTRPSREWYAEYKDRGYKAQVLIDDDGSIAGKGHYMPIEYSPFTGRDLLAIACVTVDRKYRGNDYGRLWLDYIEQDARAEGFRGIVSWGADWNWNPVSFYEHMGYKRVDCEDAVVAVWKPFSKDAEKPGLRRVEPPPTRGKDKVAVYVVDTPWCDNNAKIFAVRKAIAGIEEMVDYTEATAPYCNRVIHIGYLGGIFLDGRPYRPYMTVDDPEWLRAEIIRLYERKH